MIAAKMPPGYEFVPQPNDVANVVLSKSTWAVLGLTLLIELFTQTHYLKSIEPDQESSPLYKDVFLYHWKEERQQCEDRRTRVDSRRTRPCRPKNATAR